MSEKIRALCSVEKNLFAPEYINNSYLEPYAEKTKIDYKAILKLREQQAKGLDFPSTRPFWEPLEPLKGIKAGYTDFTGDAVTIGQGDELTQEQHTQLYRALKGLHPWRKGPFNYFGNYIDSEWRSNLKWNRVMERMAPGLEGKVICDIGCNNLYYMYRMLPHNPELVIGLEPLNRYWFFHKMHSNFVQDPRIQMELMGVDDIHHFQNFFDTVFFMGILYHRKNPVNVLRKIYLSMKKGGEIIVECLGVPGEGPWCYFPDDRYMKAPGYWFLPTRDALCGMLKRTGFTGIEVTDVFKQEKAEQRQTEWCTFESLEHFLDPEDENKTVEGHPAPVRIYIKAVKG